MKIRILFTLMVSIVALNASAQSFNDKQKQVIDAVMKVYEEELSKNPDDYAVLYSRANQYFLMDDYNKALQDVNNALKLTTREDKETLLDEYVLRARIYNAVGNRKNELADWQEAYRLSPQSEAISLALADSYFMNDDYESAQKLYQQLYRANNLNYSAMVGLAKVEVKNRNYGKATEYVDEAVRLYPAEAEVYINRADVLLMMDQYEPAAQDLISALSVSGDTNVALRRLTKMADTNYDAVIAALGNSIKKAPNVGMFYYIRSAIQIDHNHYSAALSDLESIIKGKLYDYHSIYHDAAICAYHLNQQETALKYVDMAIASNPTAEYYVTKSKIYVASGNLSDAAKMVKLALATNPNSSSALHQSALVDIADGKYKSAQTSLNMAIINNPQDADNLLLRAWLLKNKLKKSTSAEGDFGKVLTLGADISTWRGLALTGLNRNDDAASWCSKIISDGILPGGESYYVAAVVMAQGGQTDKALDYLDSALANGYGSYYNVAVAEDGYMTLAPIRANERFKALVSKYESQFKH